MKGTVDVIAGTGEIGFSGDGGPAIRAKFNQPYGVALDQAGNLFVADGGQLQTPAASTLEPASSPP